MHLLHYIFCYFIFSKLSIYLESACLVYKKKSCIGDRLLIIDYLLFMIHKLQFSYDNMDLMRVR